MMEHTFREIVLRLLLFPLTDLTNLPLPYKRDRKKILLLSTTYNCKYMHVPSKSSGDGQSICHTSVVM